MSLVDLDTGEIVDQLDEEAARLLTNRIRQCVAVAHESIVHAYRGRAWIALGHPSWDAYCETEFGGARLPIPKADRSEVVALLRAEGLSTRAISSAIGVSVGTVHADLSGVQNRTPDEIVGADGKTYPTQRPPRVDEDTTESGGDDANDPAGDAAPCGDGADSHDVGQTFVESPPTAGERGAEPEPQAQQPGAPDPTAPTAPLPPRLTAEEQAELDHAEAINRRRKNLAAIHSNWATFESLRTNPDRAEILRGLVEHDRQFILDLERRVSWKA